MSRNNDWKQTLDMSWINLNIMTHIFAFEELNCNDEINWAVYAHDIQGNEHLLEILESEEEAERYMANLVK